MSETLYDRVGGQPFFDRLVTAFYRYVAEDELLRPMYPEELDESITWLALFLAQYYGGPATYMEQRGHPRLRMRHTPFRITKRARDAWLVAMNCALDEVKDGLSEEDFNEMTGYFDLAAHQLRNV